jgi:hypothetical protein
MKCGIRTATIATLLVWPAFASKADHQLPDVAVRTELGDFQFKNMAIHQTGVPGYTRASHFSGDIENRTDHPWLWIDFKVSMADRKGVSINWHANAFSYRKGFAKGATEHFDYVLTGSLDVASLAVSSVGVGIGLVGAKYTITMTAPSVSESPRYEDDVLAVVFKTSEAQLDFTLKNKTGDPLKIDWNQFAFVDADGKSMKVIHGGVKLADKGASLPPTIIPPGANIDEMVAPSEYVSFVGGVAAGWRHRPIFPDFPAAARLKGKTFSVFMPVEANGIVKNYMFTLKVSDVSPE